MAKQAKNLNNEHNASQDATEYSGQMIVFPGKEMEITKNFKLESLEFLGLGKVTGTKHNIQVKTIKIGEKLIDASNEKEICWIERSADNLKICCHNSIEELYCFHTYNVEHCESMPMAGATEQPTENS